MNQSAYWDRVAQEKEFTIPLDLDFLRAQIPPGARILDYGCGYGRISRLLKDAGYDRIIGIDASEEMIRRGRNRWPDVDLRFAGDPDPLRGLGPFDAVILAAVLTCIARDGDQRRLMERITEYLRPGGWLLISDYLLQDDARNRARYARDEAEFGRYGVFRLDEGAVMRHHTREWIRELLSGFSEERFRRVEAVTMNGHAAVAFQFAGRKR